MNNIDFTVIEFKKLIIQKVVQEIKLHWAIQFSGSLFDKTCVIYFDNLIFDWVKKNWKEILWSAADEIITPNAGKVITMNITLKRKDTIIDSRTN